jgi:uncharacterized protein
MNSDTAVPLLSKTIAAALHIQPAQAQAVVELLDAANTLPFIARYRQEATGGLDEEQIRQISTQLDKLRALEDRRGAILKSLTESGQLTPELRGQVAAAATVTALEDLYLPFRPKRRTRASIARDHGLQPLADLILQQASPKEPLARLAADFVSDQVASPDAAWDGARDIVAETIAEHPEVRRQTRSRTLQGGSSRAQKIPAAADPRGLYALYYDFEARIDRLRPHQVLALNRGEAEKVLRVKIVTPERDWQTAIANVFPPQPRSPLRPLLEAAQTDAAERLLLPAIANDVRRELTERAEGHAIGVFAENLRALLLQPPLSGYTVLGLDPGIRTGCKLAVVDPTGKVLGTDVIYPHPSLGRMEEALASLGRWVLRHGVSLIAIGNGTASRETEALVAELIRRLEAAGKPAPRYLIVSEAGASVYSASPLARAELPDLDVSLRGAVSIARRVQDPLAELVKIDPQAIGVGMYQHDVDQKLLAAALAGVVESAVNQVGVEVNTASPALLAHVAGIGPKLAERIVAHRDEHGPFASRKALKKISGLGPKAFEQAAGFLRIRDGENPLDASAIHPERYATVQALLKLAGVTLKADAAARQTALARLTATTTLPQLAAQLEVGLPTLKDILAQLAQPGRDPRADAPPPLLRSDVLSVDDLTEGMILAGTVRNVVDFGAFVDIGVKHDGLLHRSELPRGQVLQVGQVIMVEILKVEADRGRIGLGWSEEERT